MNENIRNREEYKKIDSKLARIVKSLFGREINNYLEENAFIPEFISQENIKQSKEQWIYENFTDIAAYPRTIISHIYDFERNKIDHLQEIDEAHIGKKPSLVQTYIIENYLLLIGNSVFAKASATIPFSINTSYVSYQTLLQEFTKKELETILPNINETSKIALTAKSLESHINRLLGVKMIINYIKEGTFTPQWENRNPYLGRAVFEVHETYMNPEE